MFAWLYDWLMIIVTWALSWLGIQIPSAVTSSGAIESGTIANEVTAPSLDPLPLDPTPVSHNL